MPASGEGERKNGIRAGPGYRVIGAGMRFEQAENLATEIQFHVVLVQDVRPDQAVNTGEGVHLRDVHPVQLKIADPQTVEMNIPLTDPRSAPGGTNGAQPRGVREPQPG